jgi:hypothetical protein
LERQEIPLEHPVWKAISTSNWTDAKHMLIVGGVPVRIARSDPGLHFQVTVLPDFMGQVASQQGVALIEAQEFIAGGGHVIARLKESKGTLCIIPVLETDEVLYRFSEIVISAFALSVESTGAWKSFSEFLRKTLDHDTEHADPNDQVGLDYWWLVGEFDTDGVTECGRYSDMGVYVDPTTGLVPVYSSSLIADIAPQEFHVQLGKRLMPQPIKCLGCFFSGFSGEVGRGSLRGARLDNQFPIQFFTCDESDGHVQANHFFVQGEGRNQFTLAGCPQGGNMPVWVTQKWDDDGQYFEPSCNITEW